MTRINPFRPNSPVNPGMFVGRIGEILRLDSHFVQTRAGQPTNFLITGERGIGKSSLMLYLKFVAQGEIPIDSDRLRFLVAFVDIDRATTQLGLIKRIELAVRRELEKTEPARVFMAAAWAFVKRIEAGSVKLAPDLTEKPDEVLLDEFAYSLAQIANRVSSADDAPPVFGTRYEGILILIDEADNASPQLDLGSFLKLTLERLQRHGCNTVSFGLAGLPQIRSVLSESHPSSLRLFDEMVLERLTPEEVGQVVDRCLKVANDQNDTPTAIAEEAKSTLATLSEGYPHFAQQFGFSAFATDTDNAIDSDDVLDGAFGKGGALELIGDRYYRDSFYNKIQAESYRQVLRIMADKRDDWISKDEIRQRFKGKDSVLTNALKALRDRNIILSKEGKPGVYRLQHKGFALWIKLYTSERRELGQTVQESAGQMTPEGKESSALPSPGHTPKGA